MSARSSTARPQVWLVHWNADESAERARELTSAGFEVDLDPQWSSQSYSKLVKQPPAAVVIDLSRLPSQGRDAAMLIRSRKAMLTVPLLLVGGDDAATGRIRSLIADAVPAKWTRIATALSCAIAKPPKAAAIQSVFGAYADVPLAKKLGIRDCSVVASLNAPGNLAKILDVLPAGAPLETHGRGPRDLTLWFVGSPKELRSRIASMAGFAAKGGLRIIWPRGDGSDLTQATVRSAGIGAGLVDFKISRIDETWSGLRFTLAKRPLQKSRGRV